MGASRRVQEADTDYQALRGPPEPTIDNLLRWERIKLRDAARDAVHALESGTLPTREYLDYMFGSDPAMKQMLARLHKHRERIRELETIKEEADMLITPPPRQDELELGCVTADVAAE